LGRNPEGIWPQLQRARGASPRSTIASAWTASPVTRKQSRDSI